MAINIDGDGLIALGGTSTTQGRLRLAEDTDNGTNFIELTAPASVASDRTITFPDVTGTVITTASTFAGTGPAFNAFKSSSQNISSTTFTKATFDTEEFDTNNNFASSTFTPTVEGYYQVNASANMSNVSVDVRQNMVAIFKNGSHYKRGQWNGAGGTSPINDTTECVSTITHMNGTTDFLEVFCFQVAGGTPQIVGDADRRTSFSAALVRAA